MIRLGPVDIRRESVYSGNRRIRGLVVRGVIEMFKWDVASIIKVGV